MNEIFILKSFKDSGFKYLAREKNGKIYAHECLPVKIDNEYWGSGKGSKTLQFGFCNTLKFIPVDIAFLKWEDLSVLEIDLLIKIYEFAYGFADLIFEEIHELI